MNDAPDRNYRIRKSPDPPPPDDQTATGGIQSMRWTRRTKPSADLAALKRQLAALLPANGRRAASAAEPDRTRTQGGVS